jgi:hypothetical protein
MLTVCYGATDNNVNVLLTICTLYFRLQWQHIIQQGILGFRSRRFAVPRHAARCLHIHRLPGRSWRKTNVFGDIADLEEVPPGESLSPSPFSILKSRSPISRVLLTFAKAVSFRSVKPNRYILIITLPNVFLTRNARLEVSSKILLLLSCRSERTNSSGSYGTKRAKSAASCSRSSCRSETVVRKSNYAYCSPLWL